MLADAAEFVVDEVGVKVFGVDVLHVFVLSTFYLYLYALGFGLPCLCQDVDADRGEKTGFVDVD